MDGDVAGSIVDMDRSADCGGGDFMVGREIGENMRQGISMRTSFINRILRFL